MSAIQALQANNPLAQFAQLQGANGQPQANGNNGQIDPKMLVAVLQLLMNNNLSGQGAQTAAPTNALGGLGNLGAPSAGAPAAANLGGFPSLNQLQGNIATPAANKKPESGSDDKLTATLLAVLLKLVEGLGNNNAPATENRAPRRDEEPAREIRNAEPRPNAANTANTQNNTTRRVARAA